MVIAIESLPPLQVITRARKRAIQIIFTDIQRIAARIALITVTLLLRRIASLLVISGDPARRARARKQAIVKIRAQIRRVLRSRTLVLQATYGWRDAIGSVLVERIIPRNPTFAAFAVKRPVSVINAQVRRGRPGCTLETNIFFKWRAPKRWRGAGLLRRA